MGNLHWVALRQARMFWPQFRHRLRQYFVLSGGPQMIDHNTPAKAFVRVLKTLAFIYTVVSLIELSRAVTTQGVGPVTQQLLAVYEGISREVLGGAQGFAQELLDRLRPWLGEQTLQEHWRHTLPIMWLYFSADAQIDQVKGRGFFAAFSLVWGALVGLGASFAGALHPISESTTGLPLLISTISGLVVYEIGRAFGSKLLLPRELQGKTSNLMYSLEAFVLPTLAIGLVVAFVGLAIVPLEGLALCTAYLIVLSFYWIARGGWKALFEPKEGLTRWRRFVSAGSTQVGATTLAALFAVVVFIISEV